MSIGRRQILRGALGCAAVLGAGSIGARSTASTTSNPSVVPAKKPHGLQGLRVAITTDDMALLRGMPYSPGYDPIRAAQAFVDAFAKHKVSGVYQFSNAVPFDDDPNLRKALEMWVDAGHHVGNHGYHHAPLHKMQSVDYAKDIERAEATLKKYIDAAPRRLYRYASYQHGNTQCKVHRTLGQLVRLNYTPAPVTVGFDDGLFIMAHLRAAKYGSQEEMNWLRDAFVNCAVEELELAADNAQKVFTRSPAQIWLIHGTSIATDCIDRILQRFVEAGVEFISLDQALLDPMNTIPPPIVTTTFMFHIQMWGVAMGTPVEFPRPPVLDEIEKLHPRPGEMIPDMFSSLESQMDGRWTPSGTPPDRDC